MLNFSSVVLLSATAIYIFQDDFVTFVILGASAFLARVISYSLEYNAKHGEKNVKKECEVLQEHVH